MAFELPARGLVFWPVGNGDSTTIVANDETNLQVDLNHLEKSEEDDDPSWAVVDELVERLPKVAGRPYLSAFALTHPDQDHCRGFEKLIKEIEIGELWFTPRIFREYSKDLCDDAKAFRKEAKRRIKETIEAEADPGAGNRVRLFGYSDLLDEDDFEGFPEERLTVPGNELQIIDEKDVSKDFRAIVHAPFKDDDTGERNDTSLGLQVTLSEGNQDLRALLFGDLSYPIIKRIFKVSSENDLAWNVLLAPHHCSKSAMYWKDEDDEEEELKSHIVDDMDNAAKDPNRVISSSIRCHLPTNLGTTRRTQRRRLSTKRSPIHSFARWTKTSRLLPKLMMGRLCSPDPLWPLCRHPRLRKKRRDRTNHLRTRIPTGWLDE